MKNFIAKSIILSLIVSLTSCGTILYPERKTQGPKNQLDPAVVVLDAIGLIFFIIPGVIAFAVDFNNDTIYLPTSGARTSIDHFKKENMMAINAGDALDIKTVETIVAEHTGKNINLTQAEAYKIVNGQKVKVLYILN